MYFLLVIKCIGRHLECSKFKLSRHDLCQLCDSIACIDNCYKLESVIHLLNLGMKVL